MNTVAAIGATHEIEGFALAGVRVIQAGADAEVIAAWAELGDDIGLVILSPAAALVLDGQLAERPEVLTAVMP